MSIDGSKLTQDEVEETANTDPKDFNGSDIPSKEHVEFYNSDNSKRFANVSICLYIRILETC